MKAETVIEVANELIGPITPVGETRADEKRFENLKVAMNLYEWLNEELKYIAQHKDKPQHSISKAGKAADKFLKIMDEY